jgi:tetratricopeptide (TPR) repeat protein
MLFYGKQFGMFCIFRHWYLPATMKKISIVLGLLLLCCTVHAQTKVLDSLQKYYRSVAYDTAKILALAEIAFQYRTNQPDTCIFLAQQALAQSEKIHFLRGQGRALNVLGTAYETQSDYARSLECHRRGLAVFEAMNAPKDEANALNSIGIVYKEQGNFPLALEFYHKALQIREKIQDKKGVSASYNNIGNVYRHQNDLAKSLEYHQKSLKIKEELNDKQGIAYSLNNMGNVYESLGDFAKALEYHQKSLKIKEELNDKQGIAYSHNNIGNVYKQQKQYDLAIEYYLKSLKIKSELKEKRGSTYSLVGLAQVYQQKNDLEKSNTYAQQALQLAYEIQALKEVKDAGKILYENHKQQGQYAQALQYLETYKQANDSLFNTEKTVAIAKLEAQSELERKQREIELLNKSKEILAKDAALQRIESEKERNARLAVEKEAEAVRLLALAQSETDKRKQDSLQALAQRTRLEADKHKIESQNQTLEAQKEKEAKELQQIISALVLVGFLSVIIFTYFVYRSRQKEKKAKEEILSKNVAIILQKEEMQQTLQVVEEQRNEIHKQNQNIIASINYALRIQQAIMPSESEIRAFFPESFVFFSPRDIVSGDFYWFADKGDKQIVAVADCTGHGVSGAFMTMIANNMLDHIVHEQEVHYPEQILNLMPDLLEKTLSHSQNKVTDGMDIAIMTICRRNGNTEKVMYAGAMNPLYFVKNGELTEIKADKIPIGGGRPKAHFCYQRHEIEPPFDDCTFYLTTDGYQDQFGGEKRRKMMVARLKQQLIDAAHLPLNDQKQHLYQFFHHWKGAEKQTDDVLVLGLRV